MLNDTFPVIFKHCGHAEKKARRETSALPHKTHTTLTTAYSADQDWFPKDTSLSLFGPREGVFCSQTILGSRRRRRSRSREALALSRAKTKVDLSRVTDSIESCIWSREAVQCCMCCCCRMSVGCRWAASMLHPNFSCLYHNVFSSSTSQIPGLTKLRVAIFTIEMKCYTQ